MHTSLGINSKCTYLAKPVIKYKVMHILCFFPCLKSDFPNIWNKTQGFTGLVYLFFPFFQPIKLALRKQGINWRDPKPISATFIFVAKIIELESKTKEVQSIFVWKFPTKGYLKRLSFGITCNKAPFNLILVLKPYFSTSFPSQWYNTEPQDSWV